MSEETFIEWIKNREYKSYYTSRLITIIKKETSITNYRTFKQNLNLNNACDELKEELEDLWIYYKERLKTQDKKRWERISDLIMNYGDLYGSLEKYIPKDFWPRKVGICKVNRTESQSEFFCRSGLSEILLRIAEDNCGVKDHLDKPKFHAKVERYIRKEMAKKLNEL